MNQDKANVILVLAQAASHLQCVTSAGKQTQEILQEISNLVCHKEIPEELQQHPAGGEPWVLDTKTGEMHLNGAAVSDKGSNASVNEDAATPFQELNKILKHLGLSAPEYALIRKGLPLSPGDAMCLSHAQDLAHQLLDKKKRDLPYNKEADLLAAAGYAVVKL